MFFSEFCAMFGNLSLYRAPSVVAGVFFFEVNLRKSSSAAGRTRHRLGNTSASRCLVRPAADDDFVICYTFKRLSNIKIVDAYFLFSRNLGKIVYLFC